MCPGLIDGHIHLESTFLSPVEFCNVVALHGTSAVICDPHEIANVCYFTFPDEFKKVTLVVCKHPLDVSICFSFFEILFKQLSSTG